MLISVAGFGQLHAGTWKGTGCVATASMPSLPSYITVKILDPNEPPASCTPNYYFQVTTTTSFLTTSFTTLQSFWKREAKSEIPGIVRQSSRTKRPVKAWCYHEPLPVGSSSQLLLVAGLPAFTLQQAKGLDHQQEEAGCVEKSLAEMLCKRDPPLQENSNTSEMWHLQVWQFSCRRKTTQEETHLFHYFHHGLMTVVSIQWAWYTEISKWQSTDASGEFEDVSCL